MEEENFIKENIILELKKVKIILIIKKIIFFIF